MCVHFNTSILYKYLNSNIDMYQRKIHVSVFFLLATTIPSSSTDAELNNSRINTTSDYNKETTFNIYSDNFVKNRLQEAFNALSQIGLNNIIIKPINETNTTNIRINLIHANGIYGVHDSLHKLGYKNITLFSQSVSTLKPTESQHITNKSITMSDDSLSNQVTLTNDTIYASTISTTSSLSHSSTTEQLETTTTQHFSSSSIISEVKKPLNETSIIANYTVPTTYTIHTTPENTTTLRNLTETLIYSWVILNHGITAPTQQNRNNANNTTHWRNTSSSLIEVIKQQTYDLGKWTKLRYSNFCDHYDATQVTILSENSEFMLKSTESFVDGLFPPIDDTNKLKTIPIHAIPSTLDLLMITTSSIDQCPQYKSEIEKEEQMPEWGNLYHTYHDVFNYTAINGNYNFTFTSVVSDLNTMYECNKDLTVKKLSGSSLPLWVHKVYPELMNTLSLKYLQSLTGTRNLQKLKTGPAIDTIIRAMKNKVERNFTQKLHILSGNAVCLISIMNALGINNSVSDLYASALLLELHQKNEQLVLTVSIKNSTHEPYLLTIPKCQTECPLDDFVQLTHWLVSVNWEEECTTIFIGNLNWSTPLLVAGLVVIIVLIFLTILILVKLCRCFNKRTARISSNR